MSEWFDTAYASIMLVSWIVGGLVAVVTLIVVVLVPLVIPLAKGRWRDAALHLGVVLVAVIGGYLVAIPLLVILFLNPMGAGFAPVVATLCGAAALFFVIKRSHDMAPVGWVWIKQIRLPGLK